MECELNDFVFFQYVARNFCVKTSLAENKDQLDDFLNDIKNEYARLNVNSSHHVIAIESYQKALDAYRTALTRFT